MNKQKKSSLLRAAVLEVLESRALMSVTGPIFATPTPAPTPASLSAPTNITVTRNAANSALLKWSPVNNATGYIVLRSINGGSYTQETKLTGNTASSFTDGGLIANTKYSYEVEAITAAATSAPSSVALVTTEMSIPSNVAAQMYANTSSNVNQVAVSWMDSDANVAGYRILRSTQGGAFTQVGQTSSGSTQMFVDSTATAPDTTYKYEIQAFDAGTSGAISALSMAASITTAAGTPTGLAGLVQNGKVTLTWSEADALATGYTLLRSTNGTSFTQLAQVNGNTNKSYVDTTVTPGTVVYYEVYATGPSSKSGMSNVASVTVPTGNPVVITTRYGDELVVTEGGKDDAVSISQTGSTLSITGDGLTITDPVPAAGLFVYTRGGTDTISIGQSVSTRTTIDSIDGAPTVINSQGTSVIVWDDSTDIVTGKASVHSVVAFAGGVSKALGASLANPSDSGPTSVENGSLFGTGPIPTDANQGEVGDCYFISTLAAFANTNPTVLLNSAVDLGDGTYAVEFYSNGKPSFYRVNNSFSTYGSNFWFAHPGANGTLWAAVMEKAFADFRYGQNTYSSLNGGYFGEVYSDLNVSWNNINESAYTDAALYQLLSTDLQNGAPVTFGTYQSPPNLVGDHGYTLMGVSKVNGVNYYTVRNPWGVQGDAVENSSGIATLTYAQLCANFAVGTA